MSVRQIATYWAWLAGIIALLLVVLVPTPTVVTRAAAPITEENWTVPRLPSKGDAGADIAELAKSNLWGGQTQAESQLDERAKQWRLAGLAGQGRDRHALVQFGDDRIMPLKAGDRFPDGTLIADIKDNGVCVQIEGKKRLLPLAGQTIPIVW